MANSLLPGGALPNTLYTVDLGTGQATALGAIVGINGILRDISVLDQATVPEPATALLLALGGAMYVRRRLRR